MPGCFAPLPTTGQPGRGGYDADKHRGGYHDLSDYERRWSFTEKDQAHSTSFPLPCRPGLRTVRVVLQFDFS